MNHFSGRKWWRVTAVANVVIMAQVAGCHRKDDGTIVNGATPPLQRDSAVKAQGGQGQPRRGGSNGRGLRPAGFGTGYNVPAIRLLAIDKVQQELNLNDIQKNKLTDVNRKLRDGDRDRLESGEGIVRRQVQYRMKKLYSELSAKVAKILNQDQQKRLAGISIQVNGASSLTDPDIAARLNLTEEQTAKLEDIRKTNKRAMSSLSEKIRGRQPPSKEIQAKLRELRAEARQKMLAILTSEQQGKFEALKGEQGGARPLASPAVAAELNLTDEQKAKLEDIHATNEQAMHGLTEELRSRKEMRAKLGDLLAGADKKMLAVLTSEQQQKFEALKGRPVEIDLQQLNSLLGRSGSDGPGQSGGRDRQKRSKAATGKTAKT